jgi:anti-sigma factor RsiW
VTPDMENDQTLRRYLLGELPRHKHRLIEKSFFEEDRLFDRLLSTEEQLIADYVRGALPERERLRFESYFLTTPQRQQRVRELSEAEAVKVIVPPARPQQVVAPSVDSLRSRLKRLWAWLRDSGPVFQFAFAVITLALLVGVWVMFARLSNQPSPSAPGQAVKLPGMPSPDVAKVQTPQQPDANATQPTASPSPEPSPDSSPPVKAATPPRRPVPRENVTPPSPTGVAVAAILSPGLMRGGSQVPSVNIMPDTPTVLLRATLTKKEFDLYSAILLDEERRRVRHWGARSAQSEDGTAVVVFDIPAKSLANGYYYLLLSGVGSNGAEVKVDTYPFNVARP